MSHTLMLDIDLDFFLDAVADNRSDDGPRLNDSDFHPWNADRVRDFLERQCGLSRNAPIPGRFVEHHDEAFYWWRNLIAEGEVEVPFSVFHVDAHSDTGHDGSMEYIMTEWLHLPVEERPNPDRGVRGIHPGNYLIFATGCRWLDAMIYVHHPDSNDDFGRFHFKQNHETYGALELKACVPKDIKGIGAMYGPSSFVAEPEVPFFKIHADKFKMTKPFTHGLLCHSPGFTPPAADDLIPVIMEYFREA